MADKRDRCPCCGQKLPIKVKVPGYHWEDADGYYWGKWTKDKKVKVVKKEVKK